MPRLPSASALLAPLLLTACGGSSEPPPPAADAAVAAPASVAPAAPRVTTETVATGLKSPWSFVFLPGGDALVAERGGTLRRVASDGRVSAPITGVPTVDADGQGGLLDLALSPTHATDRTLFFTFAEPAGGGLARTAVARAVLGATALEEVRVIFRQQPAAAGDQHFGARLRFAPDGTLFVTLGERNQRDRAQALDNHLGKVVRIDRNGAAPPDNPFVGVAGVLPEIWSYGHRNPQGAAIAPDTGRLWTTEHGPQGGDEVNTPTRGGNHGWPVVSHGTEYGTTTPVGGGTTRTDVVAPLHVWAPVSIAPSGLVFYDGDAVPAWRGDLLSGALAGRALVRLDVENGRVVGEQRLLTTLGERIRDVKVGPDGWVWLVTDATDGRLIRVRVN